MIETLSSRSNPRIKLAASLNSSSQCRKKKSYLLEGPRFIRDYISREDHSCFVILSENATQECVETARIASSEDFTVLRVPEAIFSDISRTEHSQGLAAVAPIPVYEAEGVFNGGTVLALDGVADPGNAGTAVRSAAAFGCSGVVFLPGSAFPWNPKVTRASAGLNSAVPIIEAGSLALLKKSFSDYLFAGTDSGGSRTPESLEGNSLCIVTGSEARGLSGETREALDCSVGIPMAPGVESINAGVSASIILYQLFRNRL